MKRILGILLLVGFSANTYAQQSNNQVLKDAIAAFNNSNDVNGMLASALLFKKASELDPDNWMATYWTSFVYSQCGRLTETPLTYYDTAQMYLNKTKEKLDDLNENEQSDVYVLESLLMSLKAVPFWGKGDRQTAMKLNQTENVSLSQAISLNEDNPRVYLLAGTGLISDGQRIKNDGYILAGRKMLELARIKFADSEPENPLYPNWGAGWINFWLARANSSGD